MKIISRIGCVAAAVALAVGAFALPGCTISTSGDGGAGGGSTGTFRTIDEIKDSGTVRIGVFSDKSPFGYVDENGAYQGYDIELAKQIAEDMGVQLEYVSTEAANRIEYLQTGKVDIILANFTVTEERAEVVDFASPYMNVALGVVSPSDNVITSMDQIGSDDEVIVISGTTAETYLTKNYPDVKLQKYDTYAAAKTAFENGTGVAWANDNTEVIAFANATSGYTVGIEELGDADVIAPAVARGNTTLLDWLNDELARLGAQRFFHGAYEATLLSTYGADYEDTLVVEPGAGATDEAADAQGEMPQGGADQAVVYTPPQGEQVYGAIDEVAGDGAASSQESA